MDDNCGEWMECMGVASGCGEQEVPTYSSCICTFLQQHPYILFTFLNVFRSLNNIMSSGFWSGPILLL